MFVVGLSLHYRRPRYLSSLLSTTNSMTGGPTVSARLLLFPLLGMTVVKVLLIGPVVSS